MLSLSGCKPKSEIRKMTNKEDGDATYESTPRMAALLAVHLVSQILDEAYIVANAARESGEPWRNLSILRSFKTRQGVTDDEETFEASKGDCDLNENKAAIVATNVVATSTPSKLSPRGSCSDDVTLSPSIIHTDTPFIGQGDEDIESHQNELAKSTSMFINHLFDMSDVERIVICDDTEIIQSTSKPNELIAEAMNKIMESLVTANTMIPLEVFPLVPNVQIIDGVRAEEVSRSDHSEYLMADELVADIKRDVAFYIDDDNSHVKRGNVHNEIYQPAVIEEIDEVNSIQVGDSIENVIQENDVALYENAYATLNRDYDQGSDEDGFPILQDPKGMNLQEVELMTADTSDEEPDELKIQKENKVKKTKETVPTDSGASVSRKSTLVRRCRIQGSRLLACFRGWWRRKTPKKRKESRCAGTVLGMCPLSPDARRRASSLLDNRLLRSPSPSRPVIWKFNTVNEVLVNSNRWKEYTYEPKSEDCGEASGY